MNGLIPIAIVTESICTEVIKTNGIYYYIIVAGDSTGNSSLSNCIMVTVEIPLDDPNFENGEQNDVIPNLIIIIGMGAMASIVIPFSIRNIRKSGKKLSREDPKSFSVPIATRKISSYNSSTPIITPISPNESSFSSTIGSIKEKINEMEKKLNNRNKP